MSEADLAPVPQAAVSLVGVEATSSEKTCLYVKGRHVDFAPGTFKASQISSNSPSRGA